MDFIDDLRNFSSQVLKRKDIVSTEEATKNSLVLPFFQMMGYDIFNPREFVPEFTADVGTKKHEKVDYAIVIDDSPVILIECKKYGEKLDKHSAQLFRYFGTTSAKFAILTDGVIYKFYTDLNEQNKMDLEPFLVFNVLDIHEHLVSELRRFAKPSLDIDAAYIAAVELKHANKIREVLDGLRIEPSENFVKYIMDEISAGKKTTNAIDMFRPIVKRAFNQYLQDNIRETLKKAMNSNVDAEATAEVAPKVAQEAAATLVEEDPNALTIDEIEAFAIVKSILRDICDINRLAHRNAVKYVSILLDDNKNKRVCRFWFKSKNIHITIPDENKKPVKYDISTLNDIYSYADLLRESCNRHLTKGEFEEENEEGVEGDK